MRLRPTADPVAMKAEEILSIPDGYYWKARIGDTPLVAIGGLTIGRLPGVFAAGADSAAVVTDLLQAEDPEARTRDWIAATRAS